MSCLSLSGDFTFVEGGARIQNFYLSIFEFCTPRNFVVKCHNCDVCEVQHSDFMGSEN